MEARHLRRRFPCILLALAVAGLAPLVRAEDHQSPAYPDTPAGKQFAAWLAAVNSGDRETIRLFIMDNYAPRPDGSFPVDFLVKREWGHFNSSQGLTLQKFTRSEADRLTAIVQAANTGYCTMIGMAVDSKAPHHILGFAFRGTETPAELLPDVPLTENEIAQRTDALIDKLVEKDEFSGVILVAKDDRPIYARAAGLASRAWNMPNRVDTKFNLGSIGKMFTSVAVMQLVERGKLTYTDTLEKRLPNYPDRSTSARVTVHQLLTHSSGLANPFEASGESMIAAFRTNRTVSDYLPTTSIDTLHFEPGAGVKYSNYGYTLLGAIIEHASGQTYNDYVREHIFQPAGMANTDNYELDEEPANLATGYMDAPGGTRRSNIFQLPVTGLPAGLGYSPAEDLVKFAVALRDHKLISDTSTKEAWTARTDFGDHKYGYGFHINEYNGTRIIGHGGGWVGVTNRFETYPDLGYTVVILNNIDSNPNPIAFKLREWLTQGR